MSQLRYPRGIGDQDALGVHDDDTSVLRAGEASGCGDPSLQGGLSQRATRAHRPGDALGPDPGGQELRGELGL
jgi:hypothetical protein